MNGVTHKIEQVSPKKAELWLQQSTFDNRRVNAKQVARIARDIQAGHWVFDGSPIRFDTEGNVIDGQHRLLAVCQGGQTVEILVVRGLDIAAKNTIDTGRLRTPADVLHFNGLKNTTVLASVGKYSVGYKMSDGDMMKWANDTKATRSSNQEILEEVVSNPALDSAIRAVLPLKFVKRFLSAPVAAFAYYLLQESHTGKERLVDKFFLALENGEDLSLASPILYLRNMVIGNDTRLHYYLKGGNAIAMYRLAMVIHTWNAWRSDEPLMTLRFDFNKEPYPIAITDKVLKARKSNGD